MTLEDCICDKERHATLKEQSDHFAKDMVDAASSSLDAENGWTLCGKTIEHGVRHDDQLDVYERRVEWSATAQMRSQADTKLTPQEIFKYLKESFGLGLFAKNVKVSAEHISKGMKQSSDRELFFHEVDDNGFVALVYREVPMPW